MAEARRSLGSTIDRNFLECGICFEPFNDPRGLPCLHAFCFVCLKDWAAECSDDMSIVSCPLCKNVYQMPQGGIESFPADFRVTNLRDTVDSQRQRKSRIQICEKHDGQEKQYYCNTCGCTTCSDCSILDPTHRGHTFIRLKEAAKQKSSTFESLTKKVETVNQLYKDALSKTSRVKETLQRAAREEEQAIDNVKEEFYQKLEILVTNYTQDVRRKKDEKLQQIEQIKKKLQIDQSTVRSTFHEVSNIIESGSDSDIISLYPSLADSLQQLCRCQPKAADNTLSHLKLESPKPVDIPSLGRLIEKLNILSSAYVRNDTSDSSKHLRTVTSVNTPSTPLCERSSQRDSQADTTESNLQPCSSMMSSQPVQTAFPKPSVITDVEAISRKKWKECGRIQTKPKAKYPMGIAIRSNGDIALTSKCNPVTLYSSSGKFKRIIEGSPHAETSDIAISPSSQYIIPGEKEFYTYMTHNSKEFLLNTTSTYDISKQPSKPSSVTVDSQGRIIVGLVGLGCRYHKTVSIHQPNGTLISKFQTQSRPIRLTCTPGDNLIISFSDCTLQEMDQSGQNARIIQPPPDIKSWEPFYVCCSKQGELFVGNCCHPRGVYRYVCTDGEYKYLDCIPSVGLNPRGITLSANGKQLFVVNYFESFIQIFH